MTFLDVFESVEYESAIIPKFSFWQERGGSGNRQLGGTQVAKSISAFAYFCKLEFDSPINPINFWFIRYFDMALAATLTDNDKPICDSQIPKQILEYVTDSSCLIFFACNNN